MRRINTELKRSYLLFGLCLLFFICFNLYITGGFIGKYSEYLAEYRQVNSIAVSYNDSKTYFYTYIKQHEPELRQQYEAAEANTVQILTTLKSKMQGDRNCKMMYRIVSQMMEHRQEKIQGYLDPFHSSDVVSVTYIENLELLTERNMNLLTSYYLEYIATQYSAYARQMRNVTVIVDISLMLIVAVLLLMSTSIYRNMLHAVDKLTVAAQEIRDQNFEIEDLADTPFIEMNFVIRTFNEMKHSIRDMIAEINKNFEVRQRLSEQVLENEKKERRLAESKMKELQMQINPHFLFNTLSLVMRSIQLDEKETSIVLIKSISKILRSSIETRSLEVPVDNEIELLESYLYIQKVHCKGRITFQLDIRKSYADDEVLVPPLIIQPIVENAVQHGLKNVVSDGKVWITIAEKPTFIQVVVQDNGCGIPEDVIERIWGHQPTKSIGLGNVLERLQLLYHREDVMEIESGGEGTRITLYLYKNLENTNDKSNDS